MPESPVADAAIGNATFGDVARVAHLKPDPSVLSAIGRGHSLNSAIADLVDNSIDAGAERIGIRFMVRSGFVKSLRISDDGVGMNGEQLMEAMTLGRRREYGDGALGHFGMGLKAASMSQGRRLEVFTNCGYESIQGVRMLRNDAGGGFEIDVLTGPASWDGYHLGTHRGIDSTGTVVQWSLLDSVSVAAVPSARQKWLDGVITGLRGELGLTFHRLIAEGALRIEIDEFDLDYNEPGAPRTVAPIDPFDFHHSGRTGYPKAISAELPDGTPIHAACHVLPPNSAAPAARLLGKPRLDWQGLYVYRNNRLLQAGGWLSLLADHRPEWQLARVAIDLDEATLSAVGINPEKRGVVLRPDFTQTLEIATSVDGTTFRGFLEDARETLQAANVRRTGPKPITQLGEGLTDVAREAVHEILGTRPDARPACIRWRTLDEDRLFNFDHANRTLWMNAGYRSALAVPDGLALSIYLLLEGHFAKERPHQGTLDQIEAWQRALALTTIAELGSASFDPLGAETEDPAALAVFDDVVAADEPTTVGPSPVDVARIIAERREKEAEIVAAREAARAADDADRAARYARDAARGELTVHGERLEMLAGVHGASDDLIADLRLKLDAYPLLTAEDEVELAKQIEAGLFARERLDTMNLTERRSGLGRELKQVSAAGVEAFDRFVGSNVRLVLSLAGKYVNRGLEYPDLVQEGVLRLIRAVEKFDYTKGFKFSTYATWWVKQAISRALADTGRLIRIPVHMVELQNKVAAETNRFEDEHGWQPSINELARALDLTPHDVANACDSMYQFVSLDLDISPDGDGNMTLGELLIDIDASEPLDLVAGAELMGELQAFVSRFDERAAGVLRMRFGFDGELPMTLDQIGDVYGVTRERIRQIEKKTMDALRGDERAWALARDYWEHDLHRGRLYALKPFALKARNQSTGRGTARFLPSVVTPDERLIQPLGQGPTASPNADVDVDVDARSDSDSVEIEIGSDAHLVDLYRRGSSLASISAEADMELRAVVDRLCRTVLGSDGEIDDETLAPRHGLAWEPSERERVIVAYRSGTTLERIARDHGRTPLAIAWQLLDSPRRPVTVPKRLLRELRRSNAGRMRNGASDGR